MSPSSVTLYKYDTNNQKKRRAHGNQCALPSVCKMLLTTLNKNNLAMIFGIDYTLSTGEFTVFTPVSYFNL